MPNDYDIAKSIAQLVYDSWGVVNKSSAARHAWGLFTSLLRMDDAEIEPTAKGVTLRAKTRAGIVLQASGDTLPDAFEKLIGRL